MKCSVVKFKQPNVAISNNSRKTDMIDSFDIQNFKSSELEDDRAILHGKAVLFEGLSATIHFYFDSDSEFVESMMIHPDYSGRTARESFLHTQEVLEVVYGIPDEYIDNSFYQVKDALWKNESIEIKHFIKDRFGDEEGCYVKFNRV